MGMAGHRLPVMTALAVSMLLAGCELPDRSLKGLYTASVSGSAIVSEAHIHPLMALPAGRETVDVVTWTGEDTARKYYPLGRTSVGVDVWVTLSPQLRDLCRSYSKEPKALRLRLQQLLGLPADAEGSKATPREFVVMTVRARDLFRPCPDPDPTKPSCTLDFPKDAPERHKAWMAGQVSSRYTAPGGYPWTRLGYTFDWNPDTPRYGASEYVLRTGSEVTVKSKTPTVRFCHAPAG
jgi:hypothetical protein